MTRLVRVLLGSAMLAAAVLSVFYGLFAVLYRDDGGGDTYVKISGADVDADLVGVIAFSIATLAVVLSIVLLKELILIGFGVIALFLGLLSAAIGLWLLATPDPEGGRQAFGGVLAAFAVAMAFLAGAFVWAFRRRRLVQPRT